MSISNNLFKTILSGKEGRNIGIPTGLKTLDTYTYGIQRGYLTTIFGDTGSGKTTYALFTHVYAPLMYALETGLDLSILYFSFEMSSEALFGKLLSLYIWDTYKEIVSFEEIMSLKTPISDDKFKYVSDSKAWLDTIEKYITVIDKPLNASDIGETLRSWNEKHGKFIPLPNEQEDYIPNNKECVKIAVLDHVKLIAGGTRKDIDDACNEFIYFRNKCNITGVFVQQANRQSKSMDRRNGGFQLLQLDDMSESSGPAQASEIVIGIFYPHREKMASIGNHEDGKYNVKILKDRIRCVQILKQRYGQSDVNKCVSFYGEIGWFKELPPANDILDYEPYLNLKDTVTQKTIKEPEVSKIMDFSL